MLPPPTETLRQMSIITPFESVTTLLLVPADGNLDAWVLQRYSPLLALLPNLRLLSLWKCDGIFSEEVSAREWYDSGESIVDWMPKGLQTIHMRACHSRLQPRNYDVSKDLAEMGQVLEEFPNVTYVSANGKGCQKRDSEPFDWVSQWNK
ncbi:hypothetical protein PG988_005565 [Apiospora saccharicola]